MDEVLPIKQHGRILFLVTHADKQKAATGVKNEGAFA
jgi:hypothetical protein